MKSERVRNLFERIDGAERETADRLFWDFSSCPADEIVECHAYEFAREVQVIREDASNLRRSVHGGFEAYLPALRNEISRSERRDAVFWFCPEFPTEPYLKIPLMERRRRLKILWLRDDREAYARFITPKLVPDHLGDHIRTGLRVHGRPSVLYGKLELALLEIDWSEPNDYLKRLFAAWLEKNRPSMIQPAETRGAGNFVRQLGDDLKALGARRLLKQMSWEDAFNETFACIGARRGKGILTQRIGLYADREQVWRKAAKRADVVITELTTRAQEANKRD